MIQVAVIGGGVVGMACAAALARRGQEVTVIERNRRPGQELSARNSGVIHAGIYYPTGSAKAETCVAGRERLYARCAALGIEHRKTGKLIVATDHHQVAALEELWRRGRDNGAGELELLDAGEVGRREPRVRAVAALWSPETGIVDAHGLVQSFQAEAESHGAHVALRTSVEGLELRAGVWRVETIGEEGAGFAIDVDVVVNAAGLGSDRIAALAGVPVDEAGYRLHPTKGNTFQVSPRLGRLTRHLVYPVPEQLGLGIHTTFDLAGVYRLGPDVEDSTDLDVDPARAGAFAAAVAPFLPELRAEDLTPDFAGLRPKLNAPGEPFRDFVIEEHPAAPGVVQLVGIESPGLTAAAEIGERVAALVAAAC
jgi:L-2-hydroxyglutarate oxidase LhgO